MKRTGRGLALTSRFFFTPNGISSPIVRVLSLSADRENSTDDPYAPAYYVGGGNKITKIAIYGPGTVLAGSGNAIYDPKDGTGAAVEFGSPGPSFVAVDGSGNGYVADVEAHTIRSVSSAGVVQTVAGAPRLAGSADGTGAEARFSRPQTLALWGDRVIVADEASLRISVPTLPDTINAPATAPLGVPFQLGTSPRTATSWQWSLIRRPADSNATLSSTTSATPTFTPDVADVYVFRVMATSAAETSITTAAVSVTQT
ncbi:MAG TPA: hypothetical protein VN605_00290, partial [Thermoanaerobaculia bacterium]|nr:hypothetical protein [Thermoanaerobaculia bacterium]